MNVTKSLAILVVLLCLSGCSEERSTEITHRNEEKGPSGIAQRDEEKGLEISNVQQVNVYRTNEPNLIVAILEEAQVSELSTLLSSAKFTFGGGQYSIASFLIFEVILTDGNSYLINYSPDRLFTKDKKENEENYTFGNEEEVEQMEKFLKKINIEKP